MKPKYYLPAYNHNGLNICTLQNAQAGDNFDYIIDHPLFKGQTFVTIQSASDAINAKGGLLREADRGGIVRA